MIQRFPVFVLFALVASTAVHAASSEAFNKTVTMSWGTSGMATSDDGQQRAYNNINTRTVYISSAGRTFLRMSLSGGKAARSGERGPGEASNGRVSLQGNRLVGTETFESGARQFIATFDPSFTSCSLQVIDAKSGGAAIRRKGPDGRMYTVTSSTGSPSCSVQSGNAFGGSQ